MWLLQSRNRRDQCQAAIDSFVKCGLDGTVVVYLDGCRYDPPLQLPESWRLIQEDQHLRLSVPMNRMLGEYPDEPFYGWLADDLRALDDGCFRLLEERADVNYLAYSNDGWMSHTHRQKLCSGETLAGALCWGGDLVRRVGWWAPPMVQQAMVDVIWNKIITAQSPGLHRYAPDIIVEHWNWRTGKRARDEVDEVDAKYVSFPAHMQRDIKLAKQWLAGRGFTEAVKNAYNF